MLSYSPYDNVREQPYPNVLITCGLNDPRVAYWEPVKWASKLKTMKTDQNEVLVKIQMEAGHFSASDRYKYIKEKSFEQSVVLYHLGLVDNDSDKDLELKDLSKIQNQIDDVRDSLIAEQETKIREEQAEESNEWKEKMQA